MRGKEHMRGEEIFPPAQEFGKRSDVFQILMPTAPARIKSTPVLLVIAYLALLINQPKANRRGLALLVG